MGHHVQRAEAGGYRGGVAVVFILIPLAELELFRGRVTLATPGPDNIA